MHDYAGKTAVITGGGSGLGAAMADLFVTAGANVVLLDVDVVRAQAKAAELVQTGATALALPVDVANLATLEAAAVQVGEAFGAADVLCANVGVQQFGAADTLSSDDWNWVMAVNFHGVINTVNAFLPLIRAGSGKRHIVVTSSASYFQLGIRMAAYVASKFAVTGYAEVLREELAPEGINVSMLFPAGMITRHIESSIAARPAEMGESRFDQADVRAMMAHAKIDSAAHVATPEHAVRNLLAELASGERYIITHGDYRHQVEEQQKAVLRAFERVKD